MKLLMLSVFITLFGISLANFSLEDLVEALKDLNTNNHAKKEVSSLSVPDHNLAVDLVTAFNKRWSECGENDPCYDSSGSGTDNNSVNVCLGLTADTCTGTVEGICRYTCGKCQCSSSSKRTFKKAKDIELGMKLLDGFKKVMQDVKK